MTTGRGEEKEKEDNGRSGEKGFISWYNEESIQTL